MENIQTELDKHNSDMNIIQTELDEYNSDMDKMQTGLDDCITDIGDAQLELIGDMDDVQNKLLTTKVIGIFFQTRYGSKLLGLYYNSAILKHIIYVLHLLF